MMQTKHWHFVRQYWLEVFLGGLSVICLVGLFLGGLKDTVLAQDSNAKTISSEQMLPQLGTVVWEDLGNVAPGENHITSLISVPGWGIVGGLYGSGTPYLFHYDIAANAFRPLLQVPGTGTYVSRLTKGPNGSIYMAVSRPYGQGNLAVYNPSSNEPLLDLGPFGDEYGEALTVGMDGKVYVGTCCQGRLSIYDPQTETWDYRGRIISNQLRLTGLAATPDGNIYGVTSRIWISPYGGAVLYKYNPTNGNTTVIETIWTGTRESLNLLVNDRDGRLYGSVGYNMVPRLFAYDPANPSFGIHDLGATVEGTDNIGGGALTISPGGKVYAVAGPGRHMVQYDPFVPDGGIVYQGTGRSPLSFGSDGRLYGASGTHLFRAMDPVLPEGMAQILPVLPITHTLPITVMQGGVGYRHFQFVRGDGSTPVVGSTITMGTGETAVTDSDGYFAAPISADLLGNTGVYTVSIQRVTLDGSPYSTDSQPQFPVIVVPREFSHSWSFGSVRKGSIGVSTGLIAYAGAETNGGLELTYAEGATDVVKMKQQYELSSSYGVGLGFRSDVFVDSIEVNASVGTEAKYRSFGHVEAEFDQHDMLPDQLAQSAFVLTAILDANPQLPNRQFLIALLQEAVQQAGELLYHDYIEEQAGGVGVSVEAGVNVGVGTDVKIGSDPIGTVGFSVVDSAIGASVAQSQFKRSEEHGSRLEQNAYVHLALLSANLFEVKDKLALYVSEYALNLKKEYVYDSASGQLDRVELTVSGETNASNYTNLFGSDISVKFVLPNAPSQPTRELVGAVRTLADLNNLLSHVDYGWYEIEAEFSSDLSPAPKFSIPGTQIGIGGGFEYQPSRKFVVERGYIIEGKLYQTETYTDDQHVASAGKDWTELLSNAVGGLWSLVSDSFNWVTEQINAGVDWIISIPAVYLNSVEIVGGAQLSGTNGVQIYYLDQPSEERGVETENANEVWNGLTQIDDVDITAVSWVPGHVNTIDSGSSELALANMAGANFVVGGMYDFSPHTLVLTPSATLVITYTDTVLGGINESEISLFQWYPEHNNWQPIPAIHDMISKSFTADVSQLGVFALGYDVTPPIITVRPEDGSILNNAKPLLQASIIDEGVGVDPHTVSMLLNGAVLPAQYITSTGQLIYMPDVPLPGGIYTVTVSAADVLGHTAVSSTTFTVASNPILDLSIGGQTTVEIDGEYMFTANASPITATVPITYSWEATDQSTIIQTNSLLDTVIYSWDTPGTKQITVTARNEINLITATQTITVTDITIIGLLVEASDLTILGESTTFTATVATGSNVDYIWAFGDGNAGSGAVVNHIYAEAGVYTTVVTVSNSSNQVTATMTVTVTNPAPIAITDLAIDKSDSDIILAWSGVDVDENGQPVAVDYYNVYRHNEPYFSPDQSNLYAVSDEPTFTDQNAFAHAENYFYIVTAVGSIGHESTPSSQVGKSSVSLAPDWNLITLPLIPDSASLEAVLGDQLHGTDDPQTASRLNIWDPVAQTYQTAWFCGGPVCESWGPDYFNKWLALDYSPSQLTLEPDTGFWIQNRSGMTETVVFLGQVAEAAREVAVEPGWQLLGSAFPIAQSLDELNIPATGTADPQTADRIAYWDAATQTYQTAWYCGGPICESWGPDYYNRWLALDYSPTNIILSPGEGFWYLNQHDAFIWTNPGPTTDGGESQADRPLSQHHPASRSDLSFHQQQGLLPATFEVIAYRSVSDEPI